MLHVSGAVRGRAAPGRDDRGMVTVELAVGIMTISLITLVLVSIISVGVTHTAATAAAQQIARHTARGDAQAASRAQGELPPRSAVQVRHDDDGVTVTVESRSRVPGLGEVSLQATAWARWEPGEGP